MMILLKLLICFMFILDLLVFNGLCIEMQAIKARTNTDDTVKEVTPDGCIGCTEPPYKK